MCTFHAFFFFQIVSTAADDGQSLPESFGLCGQQPMTGSMLSLLCLLCSLVAHWSAQSSSSRHATSTRKTWLVLVPHLVAQAVAHAMVTIPAAGRHSLMFRPPDTPRG